MSVRIQHNRGDVYLGNQKELKNGQLFLSYVNQDYLNSNGHSFSKGQIWVKDPSDENLIELTDARSINSLSFKGYITESFDGDFVNASESIQPEFKHCHVGDFWIFNSKRESGFNTTFLKGDILLITKTTYSPDTSENAPFREKLTNVEYIKIPSNIVDISSTDLQTEDINEALQKLEQRLLYKGEFKSLQEYYNLERKKGYLYISTQSLYINQTDISTGEARPVEDNFIKTYPGDLIFWNGEKWTLIPSGSDSANIVYQPNTSEIEAVESFEDWHKQQLESATTVKEAIDILNKSKAQLDNKGKVPFSQLPDILRKGLSLQGKFYPLVSRDISGDTKNNPDNQNDWPTIEDEEIYTGCFWIVDCYAQANVQYKDKTQANRVVELNSGDWIVWIDNTKTFEIIDNSDRINSIDVIDSKTGERTSLIGNVGITSNSKLPVSVSANSVVIGSNQLVTQKDGEDGKNKYFPVYTDSAVNEIRNSSLHQESDAIVSDINIQIGSEKNPKSLINYGSLGALKTEGSTPTSFINNFLFIDSAHLSKIDNSVFYRTTKLRASERNNYATGNESVDIYLPEASSNLLASIANDSLTPNYHTKTLQNGFLTNTLTSEIDYTDATFAENYEAGYENIGIGRTTVEDMDTGEITFYAKTKDRLIGIGKAAGFYTQFHSILDSGSSNASKVEHFLNREATAKTHLVLNPSNILGEVETFVSLPFVSGTLITWEEVNDVFGFGKGVPLMIPAWETHTHEDSTKVGLDTSPITIKINRPAHDNVKLDRTNDLSKIYEDDEKSKGTSTWSYIGSSQEGSLQDDIRTSIDDVVSFDSWLESQRSVATNEAFILPATAKTDGSSRLDKNLNLTEDENEVKNDRYGKGKRDGVYQRILPSRSIYPNEPTYYDPLTGKLIPQNVKTKDVEMPAVGGVILTSRSRIEGGVWSD